MCTERRQRGLTLIELILFIVIVGAGLAGILSVLNVTTRGSADPLIHKQMLAVAEAMMEEIQLQPITWCDPDDPKAATAASYADCTTPAQAQNLASAKAGETRSSNTTPFDNVLDYNGLSNVATNIAGSPTQYLTSVTVAPAALNTITAGSGAALLITVTVTASNETLQLQGYRTRHSPNALP